MLEIDDRMSAFQPNSDISRLNRGAGKEPVARSISRSGRLSNCGESGKSPDSFPQKEKYSQGRKSAVEPRIIFEVLVYGYMCGIYSTRKLEEACRKRLDFMWLLQGEPVPNYSPFARFRTGRTGEAVEDLFYQLVRRLETMGETEHDEVFIDGMKMESHANRYTFVWRKTTEKHRSRVKERVKQEFTDRGMQAM